MAVATALRRHKKDLMLHPSSSQPQTLLTGKPECTEFGGNSFTKLGDLFSFFLFPVLEIERSFSEKMNETKCLVAKFPYRVSFPTPNPKAQHSFLKSSFEVVFLCVLGFSQLHLALIVP